MARRERVVGDINRNQQRLTAKTATLGNDHNNYVWHLTCGKCGHEYGANGSDFFQRRCPECQGGRPGLSLSENARA